MKQYGFAGEIIRRLIDKKYPLDRSFAMRLAETVGDQFDLFRIDESQLIDILTQVKVPPLDTPFKRRRFAIKDSPQNYFKDPNTDPSHSYLKFDLVIVNRETKAKHGFINNIVIKTKERKMNSKRNYLEDIYKRLMDGEKLKNITPEQIRDLEIKLMDPILTYREALNDMRILGQMRRAAQIGQPYSLMGRVVEKRFIYAETLPIEVIRPVLFVPQVSNDEKGYNQAFCQAHQFPHEDMFKSN